MVRLMLGTKLLFASELHLIIVRVQTLLFKDKTQRKGEKHLLLETSFYNNIQKESWRQEAGDYPVYVQD